MGRLYIHVPQLMYVVEAALLRRLSRRLPLSTKSRAAGSGMRGGRGAGQCRVSLADELAKFVEQMANMNGNNAVQLR